MKWKQREINEYLTKRWVKNYVKWKQREINEYLTKRWVKNYNFKLSEINKTERTHNSEKGQANKGARGMPWHWKPMKDVAIYDKPRGDESSP